MKAPTTNQALRAERLARSQRAAQDPELRNKNIQWRPNSPVERARLALYPGVEMGALDRAQWNAVVKHTKAAMNKAGTWPRAIATRCPRGHTSGDMDYCQQCLDADAAEDAS